MDCNVLLVAYFVRTCTHAHTHAIKGSYCSASRGSNRDTATEARYSIVSKEAVSKQTLQNRAKENVGF